MSNKVSYANAAAGKTFASVASPSASQADNMTIDVVDEKDDGKEATSKDYYFDSYSHFGIHEEMLKDTVRTKSYMNAIVQNKHLFAGKTVLDVGCGTGILSMFAAKAGAKRVIGVDMAGIITQARQIVKANGLDNVVTLIQGKIEEIELPVDKVDIIISEWMGYFLLYESMLDSVLFARDKWLVPGGLLFPDKATIYISAIEDAEYRRDKIDFWDNVYGFDMSCIKKMALLEPLVDCCEGHQVISNACNLFEIDIATVTKEELDFNQKFSVTFQSDEYCHALVGYFSVEFSKTHNKMQFSTGPKDQYTHWKQTVFYFDQPKRVRRGQTMSGHLTCARHDGNPRDLDINVTFDGKNQFYRLR